jgi:tRNA G18 (ribose-2'-O)-methylase SpoU
MKLNAKELRDVKEEDIIDKLKTIKRRPMYFILENIYDTYNIGGLFRLADALSIEKIYICGESEIPPNSKIKKASIGTYKVVPWEYCNSASEAIADLRSKIKDQKSKIKIIAVEQAKKSISYTKADYSTPIALILGNETSGVTEETLKLADQIVEIPMWGINKSLNVIVSAAIVSYYAIR